MTTDFFQWNALANLDLPWNQMEQPIPLLFPLSFYGWLEDCSLAAVKTHWNNSSSNCSSNGFRPPPSRRLRLALPWVANSSSLSFWLHHALVLQVRWTSLQSLLLLEFSSENLIAFSLYETSNECCLRCCSVVRQKTWLLLSTHVLVLTTCSYMYSRV